MFLLRYGFITLEVTWREITNGLVNTQAIEREFDSHTKIAHVRLIV
jgi:hypothetical protein